MPRASTEKTRAPQAVARLGKPERQQVAFRTNGEEALVAQLLEPVRQVERLVTGTGLDWRARMEWHGAV